MQKKCPDYPIMKIILTVLEYRLLLVFFQGRKFIASFKDCALFYLPVLCVIRREIGVRIFLLRIFQRDKQDIVEFSTLTSTCIHGSTMRHPLPGPVHSVTYPHICTTHQSIFEMHTASLGIAKEGLKLGCVKEK